MTEVPAGALLIYDLGFFCVERFAALSQRRLIFDPFDRAATLHGLLRYLVHHHIRIPVRAAGGPTKGQLEWRRPNRATLQNLLRHPSYAGAYRFGHRPTDPRKKQPGRPNTGKLIRRPEECLVLLRDRLPASLSWGCA